MKNAPLMKTKVIFTHNLANDLLLLKIHQERISKPHWVFPPNRFSIQESEMKELRFKKGYYNRPQTVAEIKRRPIATIQRVSTARKENLVKRCIGNPKHRVRQDRFYSKLSVARIR